MTTPAANTAGSARTLRIRQAIVISLLFGGYAALYFCRADLSVATPLLAKELAGRGLSYDGALVRIGAITSFGILAYAIGKPFIGGLPSGARPLIGPTLGDAWRKSCRLRC